MSTTITFSDRGHPTQLYNPILPDTYTTSYLHTATPIIIDAGTYEYRAGYANSPSPTLRFRPYVGKTKYKTDPDHIRVGHQLTEKDILRLKARTPFDGALLAHLDSLETILDYVWWGLGLEEQTSVEYPVVVTEPVCQPNYCRLHVAEMLFECYNVPAATYAIDALLAYHYLSSQPAEHGAYGADALVVSHGYESTHVIPIVDHQPLHASITRISIGCRAQQQLVQSDLLLDYPQHRQQVTENRVQVLVEEYCQVAADYEAELQHMRLYDVDKSKPPPPAPPITIQLPFTQPVILIDAEEEARIKEQKRRELQERMKALAVRKKEEMIEQLTDDIANYTRLIEQRDTAAITPQHFLSTLRKGGFTSEADFIETLNGFKRKLNKALTGRETMDATEPEAKSEAELYPLIDRPDIELTADEVKDKRRQRLMKANADARERKQREREAKEAQQRAVAEQEDVERRRDPDGYVRRLHERKEELLKRREERLRQQSNEGGRRGASSRKRMALLAQQMGRKERGEGGGGAGDGGGGEKEDDFGARDEDWQVYKEAALPSRGGLSGEVDEESEEEREELARLDEKISLYDPEAERRQREKEREERLARHQVRPADYQLHFYVDRIRAPELLYQPSFIGIDECGLTECIRRTLTRLPADAAARLARNIVCVGGGSGYTGYVERLEAEVRAVREVGSEVRVRRGEGMLDAWKGGRLLAEQVWSECGGGAGGGNVGDVVASMVVKGGVAGGSGVSFVSKAEYNEMGGEYLKEHRWSNFYHPTPALDAGEERWKKKTKKGR